MQKHIFLSFWERAKTFNENYIVIENVEKIVKKLKIKYLNKIIDTNFSVLLNI